MKSCKVCKIDKQIDDFGNEKRNKDGKKGECKSCEAIRKTNHYNANKDTYKLRAKNYGKSEKGKAAQKIRYENNKDVLNEKKKEHYNKNKDAILAKHKKYYEENKQKIIAASKEYHKKYDKENREKVREMHKNYYDKNYTKMRDWHNNYAKEKRNNDPMFKISNNLRGRINKTIKRGDKSESTIELLGCSIEEFKKYLETWFDDKMTWENYGSYWHIDHEKPCASFDLTNPEQQKICFNWSNMIPMEAGENMSKVQRL